MNYYAFTIFKLILRTNKKNKHPYFWHKRRDFFVFLMTNFMEQGHNHFFPKDDKKGYV